jgi:hypothetical protein
MAWTSPNAWRVLVSPENGLLFWTPLALPALVGLACIAFGRWGRSRDAVADAPSDTAWVGFLCLLMVATEVYVSGCSTRGRPRSRWPAPPIKLTVSWLWDWEAWGASSRAAR